MKITNALLITSLSVMFSHALYAVDEAGVAKVVILRGQVKAKLTNGSVIDVKADQSIPEGAVLQTAEKSFVKLIFIDKSQMNLGPNSQMIINSFPKKEAGIITLVKGQIRSQVTKDYMEIDDKTKSKLYIKTKTAAMGIRGTDFQVNFNPENQNTSLITFEGKVAMAHIDKATREDRFDQGRLERVVSSDKAVMVEHGQISAVNLNVAERVMAPTLLGTKQIEALKENETGVKESSESDKKQYRNPLPPGADSAAFSNATPEAVKSSDGSAKNDPNGFFNAKTGEYKLPAGSIIDLSTVNIIPPPANAVFDPNTKTFVVPESYGKIDKSTGEYKAPAGLALGADGKFVMVDAEAYSKSQAVNKEEKKEEKKEDKKDDAKDGKKDDKADEKKADGVTQTGTPAGTSAGTPAGTPEGTPAGTPAGSTAGTPANGDRAPASTEAAPAGPPPAPLAVPKIYDARPEMAGFTERFAPVKAPPVAGVMTDAQRAVAAERISTTETVRQTAADQGTINPNTKVNFKFNVQ